MNTQFYSNNQWLTLRRVGGILLGIVILPILFIAIFCNLNGRAASLENAWLDVPIDQFKAPDGEELRKLCRMLGRPCGLEEMHVNDVNGGVGTAPLYLTKTSPRQILDAIARRYPGYRWILRDGVINMEPIKPVGEDVLSRRLDHVVIHDISSIEAALDVLQQARIAWAYQQSLKSPGYPLIDLELRNVTVREALNAIVKADGQVTWEFSAGQRRGRKGRVRGTIFMHYRKKPVAPASVDDERSKQQRRAEQREVKLETMSK